MNKEALYMQRCLQLAAMAAGYTAPNPMVGAVLVHNDRIIGEGYHMQYGQAHAEVNCINSVAESDQHLIANSAIYVSLEPCAHFGKTPPCADLIIAKKIPLVVVGCRDPFEAVNGKGIEKLRATGVQVITGISEEACKALNKRFFTFHTQHRPYIILKWAETANRKIAAGTHQRLLISNECTNKLVHKWRSEEAAILVGTNTALLDNPSLSNRLWHGKNPVRLVVDMHLRLPQHLNIYNRQQPTIIFNSLQHTAVPDHTSSAEQFYQVTEDVSLVYQIVNACYQKNIQSILVEGGARLLKSFIAAGLWDEARVITNESLLIEQGLAAPEPDHHRHVATEHILTDRIDYYTHQPN